MPTEYPIEFKRKVMKRYENGESLKNLSEELHVALTTLYRWRKSHCTIRTQNRTYTPAEFDAISRRLQKLEHEFEIIKLSGFIENIPLKKRLEFLEQMHQQHEKYSIHELCEAVSVSRGTFYNHIFRRADPTAHEQEQLQLMRLVQQVFDDSQQRYGAEKIRVTLAESGIHASTKRIRAIMQELNLQSIRTASKKEYKRRQQYQKRNLLNQNFSAECPNQIWVSDFTYFKVKDHWLYFCIILDLYSRKIIGFRISKNASTNLITATFRGAYEARGCPTGLAFHSDRGKQYTSAAFTSLLEKSGVKQSFSASGKPHDNAVAETFFATFKKEEAYRREYTSEQSFRKSVEQYIQFYNNVRPHQTLKYKTPQAFEDSYNERFMKK